MSWNAIPSRITVPNTGADLPFGTELSLYSGQLNDFGLYKCFFAGKHVVFSNFEYLFMIEVNSSPLSLQSSLINGYAWWKGAGVLFKSRTFGWVYSTTLGAGFEPIEYQDEDDVWRGDPFYSCETLPEVFSDSIAMVARGSLYAGSDIAINVYSFPRWESSSELGVYNAVGGETGTKIFGTARWNGAYLYRGVDPDTDSRWTYYTSSGDQLIWNELASAYVLGVYGSDSGWWQTTTAPEIDGGYTLLFTKPIGSLAVGSDISGTWLDWNGPRSTLDVYIAELAVMT